MAPEMFKPISVMILLFCIPYFCAGAVPDTLHFLEPGDVVQNDVHGLRIFCHRANSKYLTNIWKSLSMHLSINSDRYDLFDGKTPQEVMEKHNDNLRSWSFNLFGTKKSKELNINPFEDTCIGVYMYPSTQHRYSMRMIETRIDVWKLTLMMLGIVIYWNAEKLSRNPLFYYLCGVTLGVTTSLMILIYFASKLLPRGKIMYVMVATGWTMSFYLAQALWDNAQLIALQYREWVAWYILVTALISFIICYRFGPVTNARTKKIIQWFLQIAGLITIYYSSNFREASLCCSVFLILLYNFPITIIQRGRQCWKNMFPERRKLLTDNEYRKEGIRETNKALKDLQEYCSSPECNPWKTVLRLKDPIRFAKFMEGESHLSDNESREHDAEITRIIEEYEYTDDDSDL